MTLQIMQTIFHVRSEIKSVTTATMITHKHTRLFHNIVITRFIKLVIICRLTHCRIKPKPLAHPQESSSFHCFQNMLILVTFPSW